MTESGGNRPFRPLPAFARGLIVPAAIGAVSALLEIGGEPVRHALRYQRDALAGGQLWRLVTGHVEHLGPSHMAMNVVALGVLAAIFQPLLAARDWILIGVLSALAIDAGLFFFHPDIDWYVGLSGVLHGFWAGACVRAWSERRAEAWALAALLIGKIAWETWFGSIPLTTAIASGPVVSVAHAYGALGGTVWPLVRFAVRGGRAASL